MANLSHSSSVVCAESAMMVSGPALQLKCDAYEDDDDACSICLESFTANDPATITSCKHEYHLQCILDWSQRSKECPICWQDFVLKDPASQELLDAVDKERLLRSRGISSVVSANSHHQHIHEDFEGTSFSGDSGLDDRIMNRLAAAASRARNFRRRDRQRYSELDHSQGSFPYPANLTNMQLVCTTAPEDELSEGGSHALGPPLNTISIEASSSVVQPSVNMDSGTAANGEDAFNRRGLFSQSSSGSPQRPSSSDAVSISESLKAKFSAASARYKESLSKSTRGFKDKLLARNTSVKELSKGVQREMSAGIAGVARMIERLDLKSKQSGRSVPVSGYSGGSSNISFKGKAVQGNGLWSVDKCNEESVHDSIFGTPSSIRSNVSGHVDVSHAQRGHRCGKS